MARFLLGPGPVKALAAVTANGAGSAYDVRSYEDITIQVYTTGSAAATIKFAVSMSLAKPNFGIAPSATNVYDYVDLVPLNNQASPIVGGTGIVLTGTDIIKLYSVSTKFVKWICPIVSGYSAGSINCDLNAANNYGR